MKAREGVPLYFSSLSLLRFTLHYLNAWNRLVKVMRITKLITKGRIF